MDDEATLKLRTAPVTDPATDLAPPPPRTRFRLDAVALSAYATLGASAAAVASYPPLSRLPNSVGPAAEDLARPLVNALGYAVLTLGLGLLATVTLYVLRCPCGSSACGSAAGRC